MKPNVKLRKISLFDTENIIRWRNNPSVKKNLYSQEDLTVEQHLAHMNRNVFNGKSIQYIIFVEELSKSYDIGTVFIKNINYDKKEGEFGIFIGEDSARGKGFSFFATNEMLRIAFEEFSLNKVFLSVMSNNTVAIKTYRKVGFVEYDIKKEELVRFDQNCDTIKMVITKEAWIHLQENYREN